MADPADPVALGLAALAATLADDRRAQRFLDLTGIGIEDLRGRAGNPGLLAATLLFLEAHEPDLMAVAEDLGVKPGALVAARHALQDEGPEE
jgi:hypothetical protein